MSFQIWYHFTLLIHSTCTDTPLWHAPCTTHIYTLQMNTKTAWLLCPCVVRRLLFAFHYLLGQREQQVPETCVSSNPLLPSASINGKHTVPFGCSPFWRCRTGHFFFEKKGNSDVNLGGFTSGTGWSPIKEAMYRAKIATLEEEAMYRCIRVGARFLGFAMSRIGRIQNLGILNLWVFQTNPVFGCHMVVWVSYSQRFFWSKDGGFCQKHQWGDPIHYGTNVISQITSSHHVMCIYVHVFLFAQIICPKPIEILLCVCGVCVWTHTHTSIKVVMFKLSARFISCAPA